VAQLDEPGEARCNLRELVLLHSLQHPNILRPSESELTLEDGVLVRLVHRLPLATSSLYDSPTGSRSFRRLARILAETLSALAYLHAQGIVHGDLKPSNILLFPGGTAVLADLSVTSFSDAADHLVPNGSLFWRAPECFAGELYENPADTWGLGVTALDYLCGATYVRDCLGVHTATSVHQAAGRIGVVDTKHWVVKGRSRDLCRDMLREMLQSDPRARPSAAQLLHHPFVRGHGSPGRGVPVSLQGGVQRLVDSVVQTLTRSGATFERSTVARYCLLVHDFLWGCQSSMDPEFGSIVSHVLTLAGFLGGGTPQYCRPPTPAHTSNPR
jgi:serine/threonine protein kinase